MEKQTVFDEIVNDRTDSKSSANANRPKDDIEPELVSLLAAAYTMMAEGEWDEAEKLLDRVLERAPENERAQVGKLIIKRGKTVHERTLRIESRIPEEDIDGQEEAPDDYIDPKITREPHKSSANRQSPERSRMKVIALIVALLLLVSAAAAAIALQHTNSDEPEASGEQTVQFG